MLFKEWKLVLYAEDLLYESDWIYFLSGLYIIYLYYLWFKYLIKAQYILKFVIKALVVFHSGYLILLQKSITTGWQNTKNVLPRALFFITEIIYQKIDALFLNQWWTADCEIAKNKFDFTEPETELTWHIWNSHYFSIITVTLEQVIIVCIIWLK